MASVIPSAPLGTDSAADRSGLGVATGEAPVRGAAKRRFRFELAAHPTSSAEARRVTRARLRGWSVCADTCDSAALVVSELVTNAIMHTASSRVVCELHDQDDVVRIAVRDEGCAPGDPHPAQQRPDEEHGRGLLLVDALCRAWGTRQHGPGLLVWAELPREGDAEESAPDEAYGTAYGTADELFDAYAAADEADHDAADDIADAPAGTREHAPARDPRCDLGWGVRPKPDPSPVPGEDESAGPAVRRGETVPAQWAGPGPRTVPPGRTVTPARTAAPEPAQPWAVP
ncbi:ATP-binding protein [Streptomyces sp. SID4985]|uniref:ATP-binding protein n=1 Tax=Streptomyces sp. SID4985 TaxID=2690292 RepID=UPI001367B292|nr:ATP-binding protein [Streptomyces sp. SID4985]